MARETLTLLDYSDREFLLLCMDVAAEIDDDGYFDSQAIADQLDLEHRRTASSRLSWLARWGAVEREHLRDPHTNAIRYHRDGRAMTTQRWRLTALGVGVASGRLKAGQRKTLDGLSDEQLIEVTRWLSERTRNGSGGGVSRLALREWRHGHGLR